MRCFASPIAVNGTPQAGGTGPSPAVGSQGLAIKAFRAHASAIRAIGKIRAVGKIRAGAAACYARTSENVAPFDALHAMRASPCSVQSTLTTDLRADDE